MYTYSFYLAHRANTNGKKSIYLRYYESRNIKKSIDTELEVFDRYWNIKKKFLKNSSDVKDEFNKLSEKDSLAKKIIIPFKDKNIPLTRESFARQFENEKPSLNEEKETTKATGVFNEFDVFINERKTKVSEDTIKDYKAAKRHLKEYGEFAGEEIFFLSFDLIFYEKWVDYLSYNAINKNGGIGKQVKNLKAFLNDRIRKKRIDEIDLSQFKVIQEEVDHIYLSYDEIKKISKVDCKQDNELKQVKYLFIIGCLFGLRFSDIKRIRPEHIDGNGFYTLRQQKTYGKVVIPIRKQAKKALKKLNYTAPEKITKAIFNKRIKELGKLSKLNQKIEIQHNRGKIRETKVNKKYDLISSHTCRRSFCTNAYLEDIDIYLIMKISGHKKEKDFFRYLKISELEAAKKLNDKWGIKKKKKKKKKKN